MSLHCVASAGQKNHFRPPSKRSTGMLAALRAGLPVKKTRSKYASLKRQCNTGGPCAECVERILRNFLSLTDF